MSRCSQRRREDFGMGCVFGEEQLDPKGGSVVDIPNSFGGLLFDLVSDGSCLG